MRYIPNSPSVREEMLRDIGCRSLDDLFAAVPAGLRVEGPLDLPAPLSEKDLLDTLDAMGRRNTRGGETACFMGGGYYRHFIPAVVPALVSRGEFLTAYTPYQPEISQGTLQAIWEFQSFVALLTGMETANASLYDGATAVAEGVLMALRLTGRRRVLVAGNLHPEYRKVLATYTRFLDARLVTVPFDEETGRLSPEEVECLAGRDTAALVVQSPNFFGVVEETAALAEAIHRKEGLCVSAFTEAFSLGLLRPPGEMGADIVAGEGQSLGLPLSYGGPGLGLLAARQAFVRSMPGRIVGKTVDARGRSGFVLTLATREQHIRRERATSNVCSNHGLCALTAAVFLSTLGREGLRAAARQNYAKAHWLRDRITSLPGFKPRFAGPVFNEFTVSSPHRPGTLRRRLARAGIMGGLDAGRWYRRLRGSLLFCATENNTREEMERLLEVLEKI